MLIQLYNCRFHFILETDMAPLIIAFVGAYLLPILTKGEKA